VEKREADSRVVSRLEPLTGDARLSEIAAMLAGPGYSEVSLADAELLVKRASEWKQKEGVASV